MGNEALSNTVREIEAAVNSVVFGQADTVRLLMAAVISGGHVLIEDRPGVGKTTLVKALAGCVGADMQRIQGTSDLLPSDLTGVHVFDPNTTDWTFQPGPLLAPVVMVDELNRATPKAQSALLEAMAEGQVTVGGETIVLPESHIVLATQNPLGELGTYPLVGAQLDRFAVVISLGMASREAEQAMLGRYREPASLVRPLISGDELVELRSLVHDVIAGAPVVSFLLDLVDAVRNLDEAIWLSSRVPLDMLATAKGLAFVEGKNYVAPDDIRSVARSVVRHRLPPGLDHGLVDVAIDAVAVPVNGDRD